MLSRKINDKVTFNFYGGYGAVTGSNFGFNVAGKEVLIDCGLFQGMNFKQNLHGFEYAPNEKLACFITHAHIDHIGRLPVLVRNGFRGPIFCTHPTAELIPIMLEDAFNIMKYHHDNFGGPLLYNEVDIFNVIGLLRSVDYREKVYLFDGVEAQFFNSSHVLGSGIVVFDYEGERYAFTGDLGSKNSPLLPYVDYPFGVNYMVMESVYGDKGQENDEEDKLSKLAELVNMGEDGVVLMPVFALQRLQDLMYDIYRLHRRGDIKVDKVFVDTGLGDRVTSVFLRFRDYLKKGLEYSFEDVVRSGFFEFGAFKGGAGVVLAGSGMSSGGRIIGYEEKFLDDERNTIVFVGYQAIGTLGRNILSGEKTVDVGGRRINVRAKIERLEGYSGHMDNDELVEFVMNVANIGDLKKVFCAMGEPKAEMFLAQRIRNYLDIDSEAVV